MTRITPNLSIRKLFAAAVFAAAPCLGHATDTVVAAHYPPLMIETDTERPGYAVEVLQEAARRAGRDIEITFLPYERAMFRVQNDPATLM
ncbi:MAG: hypothetical protein AAGF56_08530, partial [Pseudomonadota bacterium]